MYSLWVYVYLVTLHVATKRFQQNINKLLGVPWLFVNDIVIPTPYLSANQG